MWDLQVSAWELALRSTVVYLVLVAALRLFGKREIGQFTLIDLVLILLVANAVQPAMTGPDTSLLGGLVIIVTLVLVNRAISVARVRVPMVRRLLEASPTILARNGAWIDGALEREDLARDDVEQALREHGLKDVTEVEQAVLESDGLISVLPRDRAKTRGRAPSVRLVKRL